ncbi:MAG: ribose-phosphate diphosphokinase [archaeon]|jgi:ribose-phosphate pyrophosphokinase
MDSDYLIFAPNKDLALATSVANETNIQLGHMDVKKINESETLIDIKSHVQQKDILLIYNVVSPVNDSLMQIYLISDSLTKLGARSVHLIVPYLPYTRIPDEYVNKINFNLIVRLFQTSGISSIYTFDIFTPHLVNAFKIPVYNINIKKIFSGIIEEKFKDNNNLLVTTADYELKDRANDISKVIGCDQIYVNKIDDSNDSRFEINKDVHGKDILIVGNRIASGEIIIKFANFLALKGAKNIYLIATHGLFSEDAIEKLNNSIIKEIYVFSSPKNKLSQKIKVIPYTPIYKEIINRIVEKKNIISFIN